MTTKNPNPGHRAPIPDPRPWSRRPRAVLLLTAGILAIATAIAASAALRDRAADPRGERGAPPLMVLAAALHPVDGYLRTRQYVGRVEAARQSAIGFELPGRLLSVAVDEGAAVGAGDVLARLDTARLEARRREREAAVEVARAALDLARSTRARVAALNLQGHASRQRLDEAQEGLSGAGASLRLAQARVASLRTDLSKSVLHAPFDARVIVRHADEGRVLGAGDPVFTLQEERAPEARIALPAHAADAIDPAAAYLLTVGGRAYPARARTVLPVTGARMRTVDVVFTLDAPPGALRPGTLAELSLMQEIAGAGAWVPSSALTAGRRGTWVLYTLESEEQMRGSASDVAARVVALTVELIAHDGDRAFVRGAFRDGDRVVASGLNRVVPGQRVRLAAAVGSTQP